MEIEKPRSLLVLKPSSFGDIVHTLPAVSRLKEAWPDCRISWLANTEWMPLLAGNPVVDEVIEYPRRQFRGWGGGWRMWKWLQTEMAGRRPDLALDFQGLLRSALAGRVSGARLLVGLSDAREGARWLYHQTVVSPPQPVHAVKRYLALAEAVMANRLVRRESIDYPLPEGTRPNRTNGLESDYVLFHSFARGKGKSLESKDIYQLLRKILHKKVVIVGRGRINLSDEDFDYVNLLNQTTLDQLIWLIRRASFVISVDSGPAHLAAALGRPMVAIHSWSDPRKVGPYRADAWVWKNGVLTQVRDLPTMKADFFAPRPLLLREADLEALAELATSPSNSSA